MMAGVGSSRTAERPCVRWPLGFLIPDQWVECVLAIDLGALAAAGIRCLLVDIDNTLVAWGETTPGPSAVEFVRRCREHGLTVVLLSNAHPARREAIARTLGVASARGFKPLRRSFLKAAAQAGSSPARTAVVGDQILTDVLGARRAGMHAILVNPISRREHPLTRLGRRVEAALLRRLARGGLVPLQAAERRYGFG